ncbi:LpqB family beta-propeller domain-containing protein [Saccharothrix australiensis]|uniref:Sporulation and spore germination protein n=1 Tax=Saccharothrix australiensis TaxID=2072 RepID=A0A495W9T2_9PSEU|nr:LpqB family beta-propeller domain-containing protein [Saccharothrix australiensis]RKT57463.1 sporulation and spore germination protein [Saccharothrix australiensis]
MKRLAAVLASVLALTGCAAIPTRTSAIPVNPSAGSATEAAAPKPAKGIDPLSLVREFVNASANPEGDYAAAKAYLTEEARQSWDTKVAPTIIDTTFNTVPTGGDLSSDDKHRTVLLQGRNVGSLEPDNSFVERVGTLTAPIGIKADQDGEWRISDPPKGIYVPLVGFQGNYRRVTLYFYNPDFGALVPDPRYVVVPPSTSIPRRVTELLLKGPGSGLRGALATAIPNGAAQRKDTHEADDGALEVDLTKVGDLTAQARKLIVAQVVKSLAGVTSSRIRILVEGAPISTDQAEWRPADVQSGEALITPDADQSGLVASGGQVRRLVGGEPVRGPAGTGEYQVVSAAQSLDGTELAVVSRVDAKSVRLRVGDLEEPLAAVDLPASTLTRPSWLLSGRAGEPSTEVWTVVDGANVVRVVRTDAGWTANVVNASELTLFGSITELRLSRDGTRVAAVVGGRLVVAAVVRGTDSVSLRLPRNLHPSVLGTSALSVDWLAQDVLVASTSLAAWPIAKVNIDGLRIERYNTSNLTVPVNSVSAAPGRNVVAVDQSGLWSAADVGDVWRASAVKVDSTAQAFYPG